ncbi:cytochrome c maturation protein CcmE [Paraburkholderia bonniea]|uniref:cytochrome c maturation protein CcmE n=1 Tax=Paraburkholderia bonniea TaxID=2152891 RepID=UPI001291E5BB|nr:cytochrome c maturation protein CcmE [Paraburkholderia bonniea]WJF91957.1 cytochrome c maturation protein CcmE [Paraburkholderia bonniea]WJF95276.1 cytochrome c maturation protein CcmE [Paraburkholderia bonniea]
MRARHRRLAWIAGGLLTLGLVCALVLNAFRANVTFFVSPSQIAAGELAQNQRFRLGGMVQRGSLKRSADGLTVSFSVTDTAKAIAVTYHGVLPDLFREGAGVVAQGRLEPDGSFRADEVLAKHDEKYMPPEAAEAVRRASSLSAGERRP